jgi:predicted MFS family arabinose efflux permease
MMEAAPSVIAVPGPRAIPRRMTLLLAVACGLIVANLYYAQPLAGPIGAALGLPPAATGLIVTLTQVGYGVGLLLIVPLGDLLENRGLAVSMVGIAMLALVCLGIARHPLPFMAAALMLGLGTAAVQVLVPLAAHMAPEAERGRAVGDVMSGLMLGIMLARPVSSVIAQVTAWHVVFYLSAVAMAVLMLVLHRALPIRRPASGLHYGALLASMVRLAVSTPILQRRALYHACLFAAFSLFWTAVPLLLAGPAFHLTQGGIALFAFAGVAGAVSAPLAGRVADRGWTRWATACAMVAVGLAFLMTRLGQDGSPVALGWLVAGAIVLDFGVAANLTLGQRAIFSLGPASRGRLNGLYMATFIAGGGVGSAVGGWAFAVGGWDLTLWIGFALPVVALAYFATER